MGKEQLDNKTKEQVGVVFDGGNYPEILSPSRLNRVLKNIYYLTRTNTEKRRMRRPTQQLNCVACRCFFRCLSSSCFRRIRTLQSGQYFARLYLGVNAAPHTAHRFTLSRLWMISAYSAPSIWRSATQNALDAHTFLAIVQQG